MTSRSVAPVFFSKWYTTPHRENAPRTQCTGGCAGGGEINGIQCRDCGGLGYHDAQHPKRTAKAAAADDDDTY